jgi:hypothetical protein
MIIARVFSDGRGSLMDDKREGRPSFKTSDVVKNEVCDVIDCDRRLTVREVADKYLISKTTVHEILVQELHMNLDGYPECYQKKI